MPKSESSKRAKPVPPRASPAQQSGARPARGSAGLPGAMPGVRTRAAIARLLDAATALFMEKGYDATSMAEIAARACASKETVYRHFPAKDQLFRAVVIRRAETLACVLGNELPASLLPSEALTSYGELILTHMTTEDAIGFHRVLAMARERFPDLLPLYRTTGPMRLRQAVARYLECQVTKARLRPLNADVAARQYFDLVAAEMILTANISGKTNPPIALIRQRVREGVDCFLHGYAAGKTPSRRPGRA